MNVALSYHVPLFRNDNEAEFLYDYEEQILEKIHNTRTPDRKFEYDFLNSLLQNHDGLVKSSLD